MRPSIQCDACHKYGHIASQCRSRRNRSEAAGRSRENSSRTLATTASLTDDELKEELARRQLQKEQQLLTDTSEVQAVTGEAVGPTLSMDVNVEGVVVPAVVDTGSKSTVISRSLLHNIKRHLLRKGEPMPELELPKTTLYGASGSPLEITARVNLLFSVDGKSARVLVFIHPNSLQECLLGMNVLPALGVTVHKANGDTLTPSVTQPEVATVRLVQAVRIPAMRGVFVEAQVDGGCREGEEVVFEQSECSVSEIVLSDSLVTVQKDNRLFIPVHNCESFACKLEENSVLGTVECSL